MLLLLSSSNNQLASSFCASSKIPSTLILPHPFLSKFSKSIRESFSKCQPQNVPRRKCFSSS
jgi:alkyl hydroperoxide reductase subunit AhpC